MKKEPDYWVSYRQLRRATSIAFTGLADRHDLSSKQTLILYLMATRPNVTPTDITEFTAADPAATSRSIAALQKDGLITKKANTNDSRKTNLALTPLGVEKAKIAVEIGDEVSRLVHASISGEELEQLIKLHDKIIAGLKIAK